MNTNWILNVTLQSDTSSRMLSHYQANTAEVPNHLHSLALTTTQICQIFKYFKDGLTFSCHNRRALANVFFNYIITTVDVSKLPTSQVDTWSIFQVH